MDEKKLKKRKRKTLPIEMIYRQVEISDDNILALNRAFDILFEEVLKRKELNNKKCARDTVDNLE